VHDQIRRLVSSSLTPAPSPTLPLLRAHHGSTSIPAARGCLRTCYYTDHSHTNAATCGSNPADGDDGSTGGLPLAPRASWQVPEGSVWGPVPQGKKKSPVYAYFVCEFNKDGSGAVGPTRNICVHKVAASRRSGKEKK